MRLTRYGHACVRLETADGVIVIDSGDFSEEESVTGADALLYTHDHYDHLSAPRIAKLRANDPDVVVLAPEPAQEACGVDRVGVLVPGQHVDVTGTRILATGGRHAEIFPGADAGANVGLLIDDRLYHPGDSFTLPPTAVETLLLPIVAPWSRLSEVADFVRAVAPQQVIPIHDALLSDVGRAAFDRNLMRALGAELTYRRLALHETCDV